MHAQLGQCSTITQRPDVELTFNDSAIVARQFVCSPVAWFFAISDARELARVRRWCNASYVGLLRSSWANQDE